VVLPTLYWPYLCESLDFPDLTWASDIGCDLPWFITLHGVSGYLVYPSYKWGPFYHLRHP
jgi:hypothetical protein